MEIITAANMNPYDELCCPDASLVTPVRLCQRDNDSILATRIDRPLQVFPEL
jgi:hypothetical protein